MRVDFSPPDLIEAESQAVAEVLRSGWITTGPKTKEFEHKLSTYMNTPRVACLQSQTIAAELTLRILGIGPEDEVIIPAYTYTASASIIDHVQAKMVMIDSQLDSVEMDYDQLERAITNKTKVIIPVDLGGVICDYDRIYQIVESKRHLFEPKNEIQAQFGRIIVMSDAAHSIGAKLQTKNPLKMNVGQLADFSCISFHAVKNLTTAEGGCVTWKKNDNIDDEWLYKQYMLYSLHGQSKEAFQKFTAGSWEYDIEFLGYKANMTDIMASIGLVQLSRYEDLLKRRHEIVAMYEDGLSDLDLSIRPLVTTKQISSAHLFMIRLNHFTEQMRNQFIVEMANREVACNVHYKPLPMLSAYKKLGFKIEDYPNAFHLYENEVSLPLHTRLSNPMVYQVIETVKDSLKVVHA